MAPSRFRGIVVCIGVATIALGFGGCHHDETAKLDRRVTKCKPVAFVAGEHAEDRYDLFRLRGDGHLTRVTTDLSTFGPSVAPDGSWLAAARADPGDWSDPGGYTDSRVVVLRLDGSVEAQFPHRTGSMDHSPSVSPAGDQVAFLRELSDGDNSQVVLADRDWRNLREVATGGYTSRPAWVPDGSAITVVEQDPVAPFQTSLATIDLKLGTVKRWPTTGSGNPVYSPDGTHVLLSDSGYETGSSIVELDLASGRQTTIDPPAGTNWTNATYADSSGSSIRVLRFDQTVQLRPQRLEVIDRDGKVKSSTAIDIVPIVGGGNTRTLLTGLSASACFVDS